MEKASFRLSQILPASSIEQKNNFRRIPFIFASYYSTVSSLLSLSFSFRLQHQPTLVKTNQRLMKRGFHSRKELAQSSAPFWIENLNRTSEINIGTIDNKRNYQTDNCMKQVEETLHNVLIDPILAEQYGQTDLDMIDIESLPYSYRESFGIVRHIQKRIRAAQRNDDCPRCWMQQAHCFCKQMRPLEVGNPTFFIDRIFVLMHHKEICLAVDTSKIIFAAFPNSSRLVIAGIPEKYQPSMKEMNDALRNDTKNSAKKGKTLILYPTDDSMTYQELLNDLPNQQSTTFRNDTNGSDSKLDRYVHDLIVIDGTWEQARKLYNRYISPDVNYKSRNNTTLTNSNHVQNIQLSNESLQSLLFQNNSLKYEMDGNGSYIKEYDKRIVANNSILGTAYASRSVLQPGRQLRRHPEPIREIATVHALQLLIEDMHQDCNKYCKISLKLAQYQQLAKDAAMTQLGPPRMKNKFNKY